MFFVLLICFEIAQSKCIHRTFEECLALNVEYQDSCQLSKGECVLRPQQCSEIDATYPLNCRTNECYYSKRFGKCLSQPFTRILDEQQGKERNNGKHQHDRNDHEQQNQDPNSHNHDNQNHTQPQFPSTNSTTQNNTNTNQNNSTNNDNTDTNQQDESDQSNSSDESNESDETDENNQNNNNENNNQTNQDDQNNSTTYYSFNDMNNIDDLIEKELQTKLENQDNQSLAISNYAIILLFGPIFAI